MSFDTSFPFIFWLLNQWRQKSKCRSAVKVSRSLSLFCSVLFWPLRLLGLAGMPPSSMPHDVASCYCFAAYLTGCFRLFRGLFSAIVSFHSLRLCTVGLARFVSSWRFAVFLFVDSQTRFHHFFATLLTLCLFWPGARLAVVGEEAAFVKRSVAGPAREYCRSFSVNFPLVLYSATCCGTYPAATFPSADEARFVTVFSALASQRFGFAPCRQVHFVFPFLEVLYSFRNCLSPSLPILGEVLKVGPIHSCFGCQSSPVRYCSSA